jgi:hypothetical protein
MNPNAWRHTADGTAARARAERVALPREWGRIDVLDMIETAEEATAEAQTAGAEGFNREASRARCNLRGAFHDRHLLTAEDRARLTRAIRSAERTFGNYIDLPTNYGA